MRDYHQLFNEHLGLFCYGLEDNPREWSLWREVDDVQLTPWFDLGPEGGIWVIWDDEEEYMLVLERRDDSASPPLLQQALMHLPSGRMTDFIFAGDRSFETSVGIECVVNMGRTLLMLAFPHDYPTRGDLLGASLYDRHLRELVGPCIASISPCADRHRYVLLALRRFDMSVGYGVFDYVEAHFVVPAEYDDVIPHQGLWICNRGETSDLRNEEGRIVATYPHALYQSSSDDGMLYAKRNGCWGRADAHGQITLEPYADDPSELDAEVKRFSRLGLSTVAEAPLCLDATNLQALVKETGVLGMSIKYEGAGVEAGDGMLDVGRAELPGAIPALLLEDRWGDLKFLVLAALWRKLPAGTVLRLQGKSRALALVEGCAEGDFLRDVLAQSIEMN